MKNPKLKLTLISLLSIVIVFILSLCIYLLTFSQNPKVNNLSIEESNILINTLNQLYPEKIISYPEYDISKYNENLQINAKSAILIDAKTGTIVYEKNADEIIPPASMTKLVVMYTIFKEIQKGKISLKDIVPLPPESWAINAPPQSSLMYLSKGDIVTLEQLMLGMSVMSGNDAAVACACYVAGTVENFIKIMNQHMADIGLTNTKFVDSSGYSELNQTTAREFVQFIRIYLNTFPEALTKFHNKTHMTFKGTTFTSTNKVLGKVEGIDGIKTGFIYESGYNYALTCIRNNTRIISIIMGGPGQNSIEGNKFRIIDSSLLTEWFYSYYHNVMLEQDNFNVNVFLGTTNATKLIPSSFSLITLPKSDDKLTVKKNIPQYVNAPIKVGEQLGSLEYYLGNTLVKTVPLVSDRNINKSNSIKVMIDKIVRIFYKFSFTN